MTKQELDKHYGVEGVAHLYPFKKTHKSVSIIPFKFVEKDNLLYNLRAIRDGGYMFRVIEGNYVRLVVDGEMMMSDTGMERISNKEIIDKANGHVLIAGLGIGMVIHNLLKNAEVKSILVIEKSNDVIQLVAPKFQQPKVTIMQGDIFDYTPSKGRKFDTIYFDIWPEIDTDNLVDIKKLHDKFKYYKNRSNPNCYMNSWMKEYLQKEKRKEKTYGWY